MTWNGIDLGGVLAALASIVTALLGWVATSIKKKQEADTKKAKAEVALLKLAAIATGMAGRAWDTLSPKLQLALADGTISAEERADIEAAVQALLKDFTSSDDLAEIAAALGIPLPGLVAKIAAMLIDKFAFAHDPDVPTESSLAYPVSRTNSMVDPQNPNTNA